MPDNSVGRRRTVKLGNVEGDLQVGRNATIEAESGARVVVTGDVIFDGGATIDCSLECNAVHVKARPHTGGTVEVRGDLTAREIVDVADSLEVAGTAKAGNNIDVGGHLTAGAIVSKHIRVGGHLKTEGPLESESVDVAGHMSARGKVKMIDLHVGGHAEVGGGTISGSIQVRGHFSSNSSLEYGELQGYGNLDLPADSKGGRLSVLGRVRFGGDTFCKVIEVKGTADVMGDCGSDEVEVLGKLRVSGALRVSKGFKISGSANVGKQVECQQLIVEGRLEADTVLVVGDADLSGELSVVHGLKCTSIVVRRGARANGPLVGGLVEIGGKPGFGRWPSGWSGAWPTVGQMTNVEDVYGVSVRIGPYSRVKRVFAEEVQMENGSIADQVTYTKELKLPFKYYVHQPPQKTAQLPEPPL